MSLRVGDWVLVKGVYELVEPLKEYADCVMQVRKVEPNLVTLWGSDKFFLEENIIPLILVEGRRCRRPSRWDIGSDAIFDVGDDFITKTLTPLDDFNKAYVSIELDILVGKYKVVEHCAGFPTVGDMVSYLQPMQKNEKTCVSNYQEVVVPRYEFSCTSYSPSMYIPGSMFEDDLDCGTGSVKKEETTMALLSLCIRNIRKVVWSVVAWAFVSPLKRTFKPVATIAQFSVCYLTLVAAGYFAYGLYQNPQSVVEWISELSPVEIRLKNSEE